MQTQIPDVIYGIVFSALNFKNRCVKRFMFRFQRRTELVFFKRIVWLPWGGETCFFHSFCLLHLTRGTFEAFLAEAHATLLIIAFCCLRLVLCCWRLCHSGTRSLVPNSVESTVTYPPGATDCSALACYPLLSGPHWGSLSSPCLLVELPPRGPPDLLVPFIPSCFPLSPSSFE